MEFNDRLCLNCIIKNSGIDDNSSDSESSDSQQAEYVSGSESAIIFFDQILFAIVRVAESIIFDEINHDVVSIIKGLHNLKYLDAYEVELDSLPVSLTQVQVLLGESGVDVHRI